MDYTISVEALEKRYRGGKALDAVSAVFPQGGVYGIVGRNGSGKSVLFKAICGFLKPDAGRVRIGGRVVGKDREYPEDMGFLIETPAFIEDASGLRNLCLLAAIRNVVGRAEAAMWMERLGLDPNEKKAVRRYSTGMRQRLGLAQALMEDPGLLVLDEPMNGVDKEGVSIVRAVLEEQKRRGKTMLITSHIPGDIESLCDAVWEMDAGRLAPWRSCKED